MFNLDIYRNRYSFSGSIDEALLFTGANAEIEEINQPMFMKSVGLKNHHYFLDLGCGCLRGTINLIDDLNPGHFYGADVSQGLINTAFERVKSRGIKNTPNLFVINDFDLEKYFPVKFDYILSVSLLTHLLPESIPYLFNGISKILKKEGTYYFTIYPTLSDDKIFDGDIEVMRYNQDYLKTVGKEYGLLIESLDGQYENPVKTNQFLKFTNTPYIGQWVMKAVKI